MSSKTSLNEKLNALSSFGTSIATLPVEDAVKKVLSISLRLSGSKKGALFLVRSGGAINYLTKKNLPQKAEQALKEPLKKSSFQELGLNLIQVLKRDGSEALLLIESRSKPSMEDLKLINSMANLAFQSHFNKSAVNKVYLSMATALSKLIDARDHYTFGHSRAVHDYALTMAQNMGLPNVLLQQLSIAALLHDIGKAGISDSILLKKGPLTKEEFAQMKMHPLIGSKILERAESFKKAVPVIRHHHEHFNGSGYPMGLKSKNIPLGARILCLADIFDALTSNRPYRKAMSVEKALDVMKTESGKTIDPQLLKQFKLCFTKKFTISEDFSLFCLLTEEETKDQQQIIASIQHLMSNIAKKLELYAGTRYARKIINQINEYAKQAQIKYFLSLLGLKYQPTDRSSTIYMVKTFESFYSYIQGQLIASLGYKIADKILTEAFKSLPKDKLQTCLTVFPTIL